MWHYLNVVLWRVKNIPAKIINDKFLTDNNGWNCYIPVAVNTRNRCWQRAGFVSYLEVWIEIMEETFSPLQSKSPQWSLSSAFGESLGYHVRRFRASFRLLSNALRFDQQVRWNSALVSPKFHSNSNDNNRILSSISQTGDWEILSCFTVSFGLWVIICLIMRYTLKLLLMYKGFMFETRGKGVSLMTKVWGLLVKGENRELFKK